MPEKKKPSQVAQEETPWPISACSDGKTQPARGGAAGNDQRAGPDGLCTQVQNKRALRQVGRDQMGHAELSAEAGRLLFHVLDQIWPLNAVRPAREVLDQRSDRELSSGLMAFEHQRLQIGAGGVDSCGEPGAAGAQNDCVANVVCHDLYRCNLCIFDSNHRKTTPRRHGREREEQEWRILSWYMECGCCRQKR